MAFQGLTVLLLLTVMTYCHLTQGFTTGLVCPKGVERLYADPDNCYTYFQCVHGRPMRKTCAPGTSFNPQLNHCVHIASLLDTCTLNNLQRECGNGLQQLVPHPTACQRYYDCSADSRSMYSLFTRFEKECAYPEVFDVNTKQCVDYKQATCGEGRVAAKWVCDYLAYRCPVSYCRPCIVDNPSCIGKEDGVWPTYKTWSPYFTTCVGERSLRGEERCGDDELTGAPQLFHVDKRKCLPLWEIPKGFGGYKPTCDGKMDGFYEVDVMDIITYQCPSEEKYLCRPPFRYHSDITQCTRL